MEYDRAMEKRTLEMLGKEFNAHLASEEYRAQRDRAAAAVGPSFDETTYQWCLAIMFQSEGNLDRCWQAALMEVDA